MAKRVYELAKELGIKAQYKTRVAGGNNARSIHKSRGGVKTLTLSIPTRYIHSPCCVCKYEDIESVKALVCAMAEMLAK